MCTRSVSNLEESHFNLGVVVESFPGLDEAPLVPLCHVVVGGWSVIRVQRSDQVVPQHSPLSLLPDSPDHPVVVDLPVVLLPHAVHEGVEQHLGEGNQLGEDQPDVDHLDVGSRRQRVGDGDEEGGEDQLGGQVDCHNSLEEEGLEVIGGVDDTEDEDSRKISGQ